jgi:hypothetical protein
MLIKLCVENYGKLYGFVDDVYETFQDYTKNYFKIDNMDIISQSSCWIHFHKKIKLTQL